MKHGSFAFLGRLSIGTKHLKMNYKQFENELQAIQSEQDCDIRQLAYDYALQIQPFRGSYQKETFDALELHTKCGVPVHSWK